MLAVFVAIYMVFSQPPAIFSDFYATLTTHDSFLSIFILFWPAICHFYQFLRYFDDLWSNSLDIYVVLASHLWEWEMWCFTSAKHKSAYKMSRGFLVFVMFAADSRTDWRFSNIPETVFSVYWESVISRGNGKQIPQNVWFPKEFCMYSSVWPRPNA